MPWKQGVHTLQHSARGRHRIEGQKMMQRVKVQRRGYQPAAQHCLQLGSEQQTVVSLSPIERFDSQPVTRGEQTLSGRIPDKESEHAPQAVYAFFAPLRVRVQDNFGIALRAKVMPALLEFSADFREIVDLAIVGYGEPALGMQHRHVPGG